MYDGGGTLKDGAPMLNAGRGGGRFSPEVNDGRLNSGGLDKNLSSIGLISIGFDKNGS